MIILEELKQPIRSVSELTRNIPFSGGRIEDMFLINREICFHTEFAESIIPRTFKIFIKNKNRVLMNYEELNTNLFIYNLRKV